MKTNEKIQVLEQVMAAMGVSKEDVLASWNEKGLASITETLRPNEMNLLPFVYEASQNKLEVSSDFNPERKLWGIELLPGLAVALKCGAGSNVKDTTWGSVKDFAVATMVNGKRGSVPSKSFKAHRSELLEKKMNATAEFLKSKGIDANGCFGFIRCCEEYDENNAYYVSLLDGYDPYNLKELTRRFDRVAVAF